MSSTTISITFSQDSDGKFPYSLASVNFAVEVTKMVFSSILFYKEGKPISANVFKIIYVIPSFIYFVINMLRFPVLQYLDPTTFQLMGNLRLLFTAVLFRYFFSKKLTKIKIISLILLACGSIITQWKCQAEISHEKTVKDTVWYELYWGLILSVLFTLGGALAQISTEYAMKKSPSHSIHLQNIQMYVWGSFFSLIMIVFDGSLPRIVELGFFAGWNKKTFLLLFISALNGISVSYVMKYLDSIVKLYAQAISTIATMCVSIVLFNINPDLSLFVGGAIIFISTYLYNEYNPIQDVDPI